MMFLRANHKNEIVATLSLYLLALICPLSAQNLFYPLNIPPTITPLDTGTLTRLTENDSWTPGTSWIEHEHWGEEDVFHTELSHSSDFNWTVRIGKGGQLYSIVLPEIGEVTPPQLSDASPWNDDCMTSTLLSFDQHHNAAVEKNFGNAFMHGSAMYIIPENDPKNNKAFYAPSLSEKYDPVDKSYSTINWGLVPTPSVNRGDALFYTKYRDLGKGVIEITYYFYNFGDFQFQDMAVPWMGVRPSLLPELVKADIADASSYTEFEVNGAPPLFGQALYTAYDSGGWLGYTQDSQDPNSLTLAIVHGVDKHYSQQTTLRNGGQDYWQQSKTILNPGTAGSTTRDFNILVTACRSNMEPGEGFYFRTFMVMGELEDVAETCSQLVDSVDYGVIDITDTEAGLLPLYSITHEGQTILSNTPPSSDATPICSSMAAPTRNSMPLFLMKDIASNKFLVSPDPYATCSKEFVNNPYIPGDTDYDFFEGKVYYRPYDDSTEWISLLGYAIPYEESKLLEGYQKLSTVIGEDILYIAGEKPEAHELMVWTGVTTNVDQNNPPNFLTQTQQGADTVTGAQVSGNLSASDDDGDTLSYSLLTGETWLTVNSDGSYTGVAPYSEAGLSTWNIKVSDGKGGFDTGQLQISVDTNFEGHWKLDDSANLNSDSSPNKKDVTISNGSVSDGIIGSGLQVDRNTSISIPSTCFEDINDEITFAIWTFGSDEPLEASSLLAASGTNGQTFNIHLPWVNQSVFWDAGNDGSGTDRISKAATTDEYQGEWNHWAFTKNVNTGMMNIYLNGELWHSGLGNTASMAGVTNAIIGINWKGLVDDIRLYSVELSLEEVQDIYRESGYERWVRSFDNLIQSEMSEDPDSDGIENLVEYVFNSNPLEESDAPLHSLVKSDDSLRYQFTRSNQSSYDTQQVFQYSTDLSTWVDIEISPDNVTIQQFDTLEEVELELPSTLNNNTKLFGRLKVTR